MLRRLFLRLFVDEWKRQAPTMFDGKLARAEIEACLAEDLPPCCRLA
jgi:hypothetical protein